MNDSYYFSHDYNAREDEKIKNLMFKHGWEGYGLYWALIESLYNNDGYLQLECERIAFELRTDKDVISSIINDFNLFKIKENAFYSPSALHRLKKRKTKSQKARKSAVTRWEKERQKNANALRTQSEGNAIKERKGKEIKGKENKEVYEFIDFFNEIKNSKYQAIDKVKKQYAARKKEGYKLDDFKQAVINCSRDEWHKANQKYLTPEFITRADKLEKFLNYTPNDKLLNSEGKIESSFD